MAKEDLKVKPSQLAGCVFASIGLLIVMPAYYMLTFGILLKIEAPAWMWVVYFTYLPAGVVCKVAQTAMETWQREGD